MSMVGMRPSPQRAAPLPFTEPRSSRSTATSSEIAFDMIACVGSQPSVSRNVFTAVVRCRTYSQKHKTEKNPTPPPICPRPGPGHGAVSRQVDDSESGCAPARSGPR
eukprot:3399380-Prymnesium_polylepis.1